MANIPELNYGDVTWQNPAEYPALVETESAVRTMMQKQPDVIKNYINNTLVNEINNVLKPELAGKQDELTFDAEPTEGSHNPAESGGTYDMIDLKADKPLRVAVELTATWNGTGPYTQVATVTGVTSGSVVDVVLTPAQMQALFVDGCSGMVAENNNGTVTFYAIGAAPTAAMTIAVDLSEVTY